MHHNIKNHFSRCLHLLFVIFPVCVFALPDDIKDKMYVIGDTWTYNYKTGTSQFNGNVKVDQGSSHVTADKLITKSNDKHQIQEAIAYGIKGLAHYWTIPKSGELELHAKARIIRFYPITSNVTLDTDVLVTQGKNSFQGQLIHYNMKDQTIAVPASKNGHAVLVYNPE